MYAAIFDAPGPPDVIQYREVPKPVPGPGEVLIEVRAAAMNHLDLWLRRGLPVDTTMPHIGGSDFAGIVVELGAGVQGIGLGTRVVVNPALSCGHCRFCIAGDESRCREFRILGEHSDGGFAEFAVAPAANVRAIPEHISFETAAALPVSYQTAWRAIVTRAAVRPGEIVLVVGASGGTAIAAIQIALLAGATVHAVTSGPENVERVRALGAHFVHDRNKVDFSRAVYEATERQGVDVVIENVGTATWKGSVRALAPGGRLVTYGATTGHDASLDLRRVFWNQIDILGTTMASRGEFDAMLRTVFAGRITPVIDSILPLAEARTAHERLEAGEQFGKIILRP